MNGKTNIQIEILKTINNTVLADLRNSTEQAIDTGRAET